MNGIRQYCRTFAFTVAALAVAGSLFTSTQLGWDTCTLCVWQRVFMYPLPVIIGGGILWVVRWERWLVYALAGVGSVISFVHFLLVWRDPTQACGFALPCSFAHPLYIGSVGIRPVFLPFLALVAFLVIFGCYVCYVAESRG
jgi:disulfide bond formation protein DsbB